MPPIQGHLFAVSTAHGLIASLSSKKSSAALIVYDLNAEVLSSHSVDLAFASQCRALSFHQCSPSPANGASYSLHNPGQSLRLLLASPTTIHIYDAFDSSFHASISNAPSPTSRLSHTSFISPDEVFSIADFALKASIYNIVTGLTTEIKDLKPLTSQKAHSTRPRSGHLALLTQASANSNTSQSGSRRGQTNTGGVKDHVLILEPDTRRVDSAGREVGSPRHAVAASFALVTTDAQGLKWSLDGRWLTVWDAPVMGMGVYVYTADGQLFRSYLGDEQDSSIGLGVKNVEWSGSGEDGLLLCARADGSIVGLGGHGFSALFNISFPSPIPSLPGDAHVWHEQILSGPLEERSYAPAQMPAVPPGPPTKAAADKQAIGVTHISISPSGEMLASVCASTPTTIWIHHIPLLRSNQTNTQDLSSAENDELPQRISPSRHPTTKAVLIHHAPIKNLSWQPNPQVERLLIQCATLPVVHSKTGEKLQRHWIYGWDAVSGPFVSSAELPSGTAPSAKFGASTEQGTSVSWLSTSGAEVLLATPNGATIEDLGSGGSRNGLGQSAPLIKGEGPEDAFDEDEEHQWNREDDTFAFRRAGLRA